MDKEQTKKIVALDAVNGMTYIGRDVSGSRYFTEIEDYMVKETSTFGEIYDPSGFYKTHTKRNWTHKGPISFNMQTIVTRHTLPLEEIAGGNN